MHSVIDDRSLGSRVPTCWALSTAEAGMRNQVLGLAAAVGYPYELKGVEIRKPWKWLPGHWPTGLLSKLTPDSSAIAPPWPDLLISCGRRSAAVALHIRRQSRGRTIAVHIQHPQVPLDNFDLVIPPWHDQVSGSNVFTTQLAIHRVTPAVLEEGRSQFRAKFAALPRPLVSVVIGGPNKCYKFERDSVEMLCDHLLKLVNERGAGLVVTASRRTRPENLELLRTQLDHPRIWFWNGEGANPYFGMLGLADYVVVTGDSVSMVSEACASGKPVHVFELPGGNPRFRAFHQRLFSEGITRPFRGQLEDWTAIVPNDTELAARAVQEIVARRSEARAA